MTNEKRKGDRRRWDCNRNEKICITKIRPIDWANAVILIFKKENYEKDYRPIRLLSQIYKLFSKVIINQLIRLLPTRRIYLFQKGLKYYYTLTADQDFNRKISIWIAFFIYRKASDMVEIWALEPALKMCRLPVHRFN